MPELSDWRDRELTPQFRTLVLDRLAGQPLALHPHFYQNFLLTDKDIITIRRIAKQITDATSVLKLPNLDESNLSKLYALLARISRLDLEDYSLLQFDNLKTSFIQLFTISPPEPKARLPLREEASVVLSPVLAGLVQRELDRCGA